MPGASALPLTLVLGFPVLLVLTTASATVAFLAFGCDCCHLRLVLRSERRLGFIQIHLGDGGCRYGDLLGRVEDLVSSFKDVFVSIDVKLFVTDMGSYIYWKLQGPNGQCCLGTATSFQLFWFPADIIYDLIP